MPVTRIFAAVLAVMGLAQCQTTAAPVSTAPAAVTSAPSNPDAALNQFRAANGRSALSQNSRLNQAAARHARDLAGMNRLSHTGSDGSSIRSRIEDTGYPACLVAENIAEGQGSVGSVFTAWQGSSGHRANMLLRDVREFGFAQGPNRTFVLVLAEPGC